MEYFPKRRESERYRKNIPIPLGLLFYLDILQTFYPYGMIKHFEYQRRSNLITTPIIFK